MATPKAMRKASIGGRAWRLMRLAVLWARKGSAVQSLRLLRTLRRGGVGRKDQLRYGEREFSMDETPAFRFRTPSARVLRFIPCIAPAVPDTPAACYREDRYFFSCDDAREGDDEGCCVGGDYYDDDAGEPSECGGVESLEDEQLLERTMAEGAEDAGVDVKADEFIAKFYAQMKLQRQISWLQYNEMMQRSIC